MLVFIDDSGDPGFQMQKGSSSIFVIALVIFDDNLEAEKASVAIKSERHLPCESASHLFFTISPFSLEK